MVQARHDLLCSSRKRQHVVGVIRERSAKLAMTGMWDRFANSWMWHAGDPPAPSSVVGRNLPCLPFPDSTRSISASPTTNRSRLGDHRRCAHSRTRPAHISASSLWFIAPVRFFCGGSGGTRSIWHQSPSAVGQSCNSKIPSHCAQKSHGPLCPLPGCWYQHLPGSQTAPLSTGSVIAIATQVSGRVCSLRS